MAETIALENRVALVTGGSRGIGRAVAIELAGRGAAVVVNYNKSPDAAQEVVNKIQEAGGRAAACQGDVSDFKQAEALVSLGLSTSKRGSYASPLPKSFIGAMSGFSPALKAV